VVNKTTRVLHGSGLALSMGSVLTFVVMNSIVGSSSDAQLIDHQRRFVAGISRTLTIPGVWMLIGADVLAALSGKDGLSARRWLIAKVGLDALILANIVVFIAPLEKRVTEIAEVSAASGQLPESYGPLKTLEDRYGAANLLMLVAAFLWSDL